jgi:hypothetical protein
MRSDLCCCLDLNRSLAFLDHNFVFDASPRENNELVPAELWARSAIWKVFGLFFFCFKIAHFALNFQRYSVMVVTTCYNNNK